MDNYNKYYDYMGEIKDSELLEGLFVYGYFAKQLPPIFQSKSFYKLYKPKRLETGELELNYITDYGKKTRPVVYETMRNINIPRIINIPNPFAYYNQCLCLTENWERIKLHFYTNTKDNEYKVSLRHLKKSNYTKKLLDIEPYTENKLNIDQNDFKGKNNFEKEYDYKLRFLSKYKVEADISRCFPSIYTHAIPWALVGKEYAKQNRNRDEYYNKIDTYTRRLNDDETYGILVGPHSSNLISEIILVRIDHDLSEKWKYTRYIDDYTCFVSSEEQADEFITDLVKELREYNLSLNHRKTQKTKLPEVSGYWTHQLQNCIPNPKNNKANFRETNFREVKSYLELAKKLALKENNNAILNYAIKVVSGLEITKNAEEYFIYETFNWAYIYPYLIPLLDEYVISKYIDSFFKSKEGKRVLDEMLHKIYNRNLKDMNIEAIVYSIYYAIKYDVQILDIKFEDLKKTDNAIIYLLGFIHSKKYPDVNNQFNCYEYFAKEICGIKESGQKIKCDNLNFQENWIFVYEVLPRKLFENKWAEIKKKNISFLKKEYIF